MPKSGFRENNFFVPKALKVLFGRSIKYMLLAGST